ncbi:MAG TPA: histidine kinase, partial [Pseudonocardiaceae bacterium]
MDDIGERQGGPPGDRIARPGPAGVADRPAHTGHRYAGLIPRRLAPRLARAVAIGVFSGFCAFSFAQVVHAHPGALSVTLAAAYLVALLSIQLFYFSFNRPPTQLRSRAGYAVLAAQACLVYLPILQFGEAWVPMPAFLAGSLLLVLPAKLAIPAFALLVAGSAPIDAHFDGTVSGSPLDMIYAMAAMVSTGFSVYGLSRLSHLVTVAEEARTELAKMAVAQERLRVARDLHDLLGYSLSAISLKSELSHRLLTKHPARAEGELGEIVQISRQALADVRAVASGYRELSLDNEARSARSILRAADVEVRVSVEHEGLPERVSTTIATLLREAVTNILRHSKAEHCEISVVRRAGTVVVDVVNDGVGTDQDRSTADRGSGIDNLANRVAALGGTLTAGTEAAVRYRLHASIPLPAEADEAAAPVAGAPAVVAADAPA